jgi:L-amino acid N-acyltransferase YncA
MAETHRGGDEHARLGREDDHRVVRYAYGGPHQKRAACRFSCKVSVYVEQGRQRTMLGSRAVRGVAGAARGARLPDGGCWYDAAERGERGPAPSDGLRASRRLPADRLEVRRVARRSVDAAGARRRARPSPRAALRRPRVSSSAEKMRCTIRVMEASDLDEAVRVWQAANIARGKHPSPGRVARVVEKLQEPCRADDGAGAVVPDALHISMIFIDPASQRQGIGSRLMRYALDSAHASGVSSVALDRLREHGRAQALRSARHEADPNTAGERNRRVDALRAGPMNHTALAAARKRKLPPDRRSRRPLGR